MFAPPDRDAAAANLLLIRRPILGCIFVWIFGVGAGLYLRAPCSVVAAFGLLFALLALCTRSQKLGSIALWAALACAGFAHGQRAAYPSSPRALARLMARDREQIALVGQITSDPVARPTLRSGELAYRFSARVEGLRRHTRWERGSGQVLVTWRAPQAARSPAYGERWFWQGLLERKTRFANGRGGWVCALRSDQDHSRRLNEQDPTSVIRRCYDMRRSCSEMLGIGLKPEVAGFVRTLVLGYRQELSPRFARTFRTTGTLHIIAISGLHVGIMLVFFIAFLTALGRPRTTWGLYLAPALFVYAVSTGLSASTLRATLMALIYWCAPLFRRKPDGPIALALAATLILLFAPLELTNLGFVLSFSAVAGLMMWHPVWMDAIRRRLEPDPWAPPGARRWTAARKALFNVASMVCAGAAVWITTAPLIARFFNLFTPISLAGNLLVIPLAFLILLTGTLSLVFGNLAPWFAEVFNQANGVFVNLLLIGIESISRFRWGYAYVPTPPAALLVLWFLFLAVVWLARRRARFAAGAIPLALLTAIVGRTDRVQLDVLDVGHGQAVYLNLPGGWDVLIDAGPRTAVFRVIRHLRQNGVRGLQALVLTHASARHLGGVASVAREFPVKEVWCAPQLERSPFGQKVLKDVRSLGIPVRFLARGESGYWQGDVEWEVLHPPADRTAPRTGEVSLVLRVGHEATAVLVMGGAGGNVEQELVETRADLAASVLIPGEHGAAGTCGSAFLSRVRPQWVVLSVGEENPHSLPAAETLERLGDAGVPCLRTDRDGAVRVVFQRAPVREGLAFVQSLTPAPLATQSDPEIPDVPESD